MNPYFIKGQDIEQRNLKIKMVNWDSVVSFLIILAIVLGGWAKVTNKTIPEIVQDIKDMIKGKSEEVEEEVTGGFYE